MLGVLACCYGIARKSGIQAVPSGSQTCQRYRNGCSFTRLILCCYRECMCVEVHYCLASSKCARSELRSRHSTLSFHYSIRYQHASGSPTTHFPTMTSVSMLDAVSASAIKAIAPLLRGRIHSKYVALQHQPVPRPRNLTLLCQLLQLGWLLRVRQAVRHPQRPRVRDRSHRHVRHH